MLHTILLHNVSVYDPDTASYSEKQDIRITDGIIAQLGPEIPAQPGWEILEGEDLRVSVGWTDCHTHLEGFDAFRSYPGLGATRVHDAGSFGAFTYPTIHEVIAALPFPVTAYLYVGCWGVTGNGHDELITLDNLKEEPFLEVAKAYPGEIIGAKIRIDPRVNSDTRGTLRQAKALAEKAGLPLIVHPSRAKESLEEVLEVLEKDDVYAHTYSPVAPALFDDNGRIKQCAWDAMKRGVRFDLSHGSNNFSYDIARRAIAQGFLTETVSTDLHIKNYSRPGMSLAGVMTKAVQAGFTVDQVLRRVIGNPEKLLHLPDRQTKVMPGQKADLTVYRVLQEDRDLPDSLGNTECCHTQIQDVATIYGDCLHRSLPTAELSDRGWKA